MSKIAKVIILSLIFFWAFFWRFYHLSSVPPGIYVDEAALGYNAFSLLKTAKDEYGKLLPILFRSFADYKMPIYVYLSVIPIKIWGLNVFSVRFLSAFSGTITIFLIYLIIKELFPKKNFLFAAITSFLFSFLPWTVFFSHVAFEANLALFFYLLAVYGQIKNKNLFAIVFFVISAYTYHTERVLAPLTWLAMQVFVSTKKTKFFLETVLFIILLSPLLILTFFSGGRARVDNLFYFQGLRNWLSLYFAYFSPRNLFFNPDSDLQRSLPELSVFYFWMVLPFFSGLIRLFHENKKIIRFILFLLLVSPLPASLTSDPFSTLRAYPLVFPLIIIIGLGLESFLKTPKLLLILFLSLFSALSLWRSLFILLPHERSEVWQFGYQEMATQLQKYPEEEVLIDHPTGTAYIELLFFMQYPPSSLHQERKMIDLRRYYQLANWEGAPRLGKIRVGKINWEEDIYRKQIIIASPIAISPDQAKEHFLNKAFAIMNPEGQVIFNAYFTNPLLKIKDDESRNL